MSKLENHALIDIPQRYGFIRLIYQYSLIPMDNLRPHRVSHFTNIFTSSIHREFLSLRAPLPDADERDSFVDHSHGRVAKQPDEDREEEKKKNKK
jgi:hypothetical protein